MSLFTGLMYINRISNPTFKLKQLGSHTCNNQLVSSNYSIDPVDYKGKWSYAHKLLCQGPSDAWLTMNVLSSEAPG